jgi:hypothetical protein
VLGEAVLFWQSNPFCKRYCSGKHQNRAGALILVAFTPSTAFAQVQPIMHHSMSIGSQSRRKKIVMILQYYYRREQQTLMGKTTASSAVLSFTQKHVDCCRNGF